MALKQHVYDRHGDMVVDTGHKTFDGQTNCIATGNIVSNTQTARYIRPKSATLTYTTNRGTVTRGPGELREWDLSYFDT